MPMHALRLPPLAPRRRLGYGAALAAMVVAAPAYAHHGWSSYEAGKAITVTTPVVESHYGNPHGSLVIEHEGERWDVILAPPSRMNNRGLTPEAVAPGQTVTIEAYPKRSGEKEMRAERITAGGKTVELR